MRLWQRAVPMVLAGALVVLAGCGGASGGSSETKPAGGGTGTQTQQPAPAPGAKGRVADIKAAGKLNVGWAEYNPFEYRDPKNSQLVGILIDLAKDAGKNFGVQTNFVEDSWPTLTTGTAASKWDMAFLGDTPARREQVDFTDPLYYTDMTLLVRKTDHFKSFDDVDQPGKKIVVTTGSNTEEALVKRVKHAEIVRVKDVANVFLQLASNKVDAMATQRDYLERRASEFPDLEVLSDNFGRSLMTIAVAKNQPEYLAALNEWIKQEKKSGRIEALIKQYNLVGNKVAE